MRWWRATRSTTPRGGGATGRGRGRGWRCGAWAQRMRRRRSRRAPRRPMHRRWARRSRPSKTQRVSHARDWLMPKMTFIERDGTRREVDAPLGLSVLEIAHKHGVDIERACECSLPCSTCHVIVAPEWHELLNEASEDEEDMLDLDFEQPHTTRL